MRGGGYRVFLSDEDLKQWGLDFASLDSRSPETRALLTAVSLIVHGSGDPEGDGMEVEALPVEGGCFLLFTPTASAARRAGRGCSEEETKKP